jgi:hypothetical protein
LNSDLTAHIVSGRKHDRIIEGDTYKEKIPLEAAINSNGTFDVVRASLATLRTEATNSLARAVLAIASNSSSKLLT